MGEKNRQHIAGGQMKLLVTASGTTGALWLRNHPYVAFATAGGYGALHAGNASERAKEEGGTTLERMAQDWKQLILERHWRRDIWSMWIAAKNIQKGNFKLNLPIIR